MVNIDDSLRVIPDEIRGENLHIAGEHDEVNFRLPQQLQLAALGLGFVLSGDRNYAIGNAVEVSMALGVGVVADDHDNLTSQLPGTLPVKQVHEAMVMPGDKDCDPRPVTG